MLLPAPEPRDCLALLQCRVVELLGYLPSGMERPSWASGYESLEDLYQRTEQNTGREALEYLRDTLNAVQELEEVKDPRPGCIFVHTSEGIIRSGFVGEDYYLYGLHESRGLISITQESLEKTGELYFWRIDCAS